MKSFAYAKNFEDWTYYSSYKSLKTMKKKDFFGYRTIFGTVFEKENIIAIVALSCLNEKLWQQNILSLWVDFPQETKWSSSGSI